MVYKHSMVYHANDDFLFTTAVDISSIFLEGSFPVPCRTFRIGFALPVRI